MELRAGLVEEVERALGAANDVSARALSAYEYYYDQNLTPEEKAYVLDRLLPLGQRDNAASNAQLVDEEFLAKFFVYRTTGLSIKDTTTLLGITPSRMQSLVLGHGLDDEQHKKLLKVINTADASCKLTHLNVIMEAAQTNWRAALAFLERRYPDEFGRTVKQTQDVVMTARVGVTDCEEKALSAAARLREIRESRRQEEQGSE